MKTAIIILLALLTLAMLIAAIGVYTAPTMDDEGHIINEHHSKS